MKKLFALILAAAMLLSFAACGSKKDKKEDTTIPTHPITEEATDDMNQPAAPGEGPEMPAVDTPAVDGENATPEVNPNSAAQVLLNVFYDEMAKNPAASAEELANTVISHKSIQFMPMVMAIEEGYLAGFNNEIKGFASGAAFAPGIGTIPFVGYIFKLADGADVEAFKTTLESEANLRWNICTEAEEMVCENVGNTVFFLMCPVSLEG